MKGIIVYRMDIHVPMDYKIRFFLRLSGIKICNISDFEISIITIQYSHDVAGINPVKNMIKLSNLPNIFKLRI